MEFVWTLNFDTNSDFEGVKYSFTRVFGDFASARKVFRDLLKQLGKENENFFDGEANLRYLEKQVKNVIGDSPDDYESMYDDRELLEMTPSIVKDLFSGNEVSAENMKLIEAQRATREKADGTVGFVEDPENNMAWFFEKKGFGWYIQKFEGEGVIDYMKMECRADGPGVVYFATNAFLLDDPDQDYYCYVYEANWGPSPCFRIELQKHEVE